MVSSESSVQIEPGNWCLYLLECRGGVMYAGITNKLAERFAAHQAGEGAKFTRANPPVRILGARPYADRSEPPRLNTRSRSCRAGASSPS